MRVLCSPGLTSFFFILCVATCQRVHSQCVANSNTTPTTNSTPAICGASQFVQQGISSVATAQNYVLQISGLNLPSEKPQIVVYPGASATVVSNSATQVVALFSAPQGYSAQQVVLIYMQAKLSISYSVPAPVSCNYPVDITSTFEVLSDEQAKDDFGTGVSRNFKVVQISIVNQCPLPIMIPLAGMALIAPPTSRTSATSNETVAPTSLDHVTSVYTVDRQSTGTRARFFNVLAAAVTVGSAIQPFFGPGFTQGVSIAGGGLTAGLQKVFADMSALQLQNLASESFGNVEQLSAFSGTVKKVLFVPSNLLDNGEFAKALGNGKVTISFITIPVTTSGTSSATPVKSGNSSGSPAPGTGQ